MMMAILRQHGGTPYGDKLQRVVQRLLNGQNPSDHVIALTDVYTGSHPPDFTDADDAKIKMLRLFRSRNNRNYSDQFVIPTFYC
jgi:hypothetical protein